MKYMIDLWKVICVLLLVGSISVYAIGTSDITLGTPETGTWTNESNYTSGYTFSWSDTDDNTYATANCTLYVGDTNLLSGLVTNSYIQDSKIATEDTTHTLYQINDFVSNSSALYWTVKCYNTTAIDYQGGWSPTARTIYVDNVTPTVDIISNSITNNTWNGSNSVRFEVNTTDTGYAGSGSFTIDMLNRSSLVSLGSDTTTEQEAINLTATLLDGNHTLTIKVCDPANNCNTSVKDYGTYIDTVSPSIAFIDSTEPDNGNTSVTYVEINISLVETNMDTMVLTWDGTAETIDYTDNCTGSSPQSCFINKTGKSAQHEIQYSINVTDEADNEAIITRNVSVDIASTTVTLESNWTMLDSVATFDINVTDTTPLTCSARIYDRSNILKSTKTGTYDSIRAVSNCSGTFSASDIVTEGAFTVEYVVTDEVGNTGLGANKSGVLKNLYTGWNLVSWVDYTDTVSDICDGISSCTQMSWFNNSAQSYISYSIATPSVNADTVATNGDAVYIYVSSDDYLIMNDQIPASGSPKENISLSDGWNTLGLFYNTTINTTLSAVNHNSSEDVLSWVSEYDSNTESYTSCSRSLQLCTGTTSVPKSLVLRKGDAVWVLSEYSDAVLNRTLIKG